MAADDLLTAREREALGDFQAKVSRLLGTNLLALKLFGSKARGDAEPDSDIDVLVEVMDARVEVEDAVLAIAFDANLEHDVYISPRVITRLTLTDPVWRLTGFVRAREREGVLL